MDGFATQSNGFWKRKTYFETTNRGVIVFRIQDMWLTCSLISKRRVNAKVGRSTVDASMEEIALSIMMVRLLNTDLLPAEEETIVFSLMGRLVSHNPQADTIPPQDIRVEIILGGGDIRHTGNGESGQG